MIVSGRLPRVRRFFRGVGFIVLGGLLLWANCRAAGRDFFYPENSAKFDRRLWHISQKRVGFANPRLFMAQDLIDRHLPLGMSAKDVSTLLGEPDLVEQGDDSHFRHWKPQPHTVYTFGLGNWGMRLEGASLNILFDDNERLSMARVYPLD